MTERALLTTSPDVARRSWTVALGRWIYAALTVLLFAIVLTGFWPSYFARLLAGTSAHHWIIHLHAAVFIGWMVLLLVQVALVRSGRTRLHRRLGLAASLYALFIVFMGLVATFASPVIQLRAGTLTLDRAAADLLAPLGDMMLFAGFFGAAYRFRHHHELHKRLVLAATVALMFAPVARMGFRSEWLLLGVWLSPMLVAMGVDRVTRRRVSSVYYVSVAIMCIAFFRIFYADTEAWRTIGRGLLSPFLPDAG